MFLVLAAAAGILAGILINRAADNLPPPDRRSLFAAPRCPYCESARSTIEQFGILAFALRRDRCHNCTAPLRLRAPVTEFATGALFAFLAARYSFSLYLVIIWLFTCLLILVTIIDVEHKLILTVVILPATALALLLSPVVFGGTQVTFENLPWDAIPYAILGAGVGYAITLVMYFFGKFFVALVNRNRNDKINTVAFGMGDVRLGGFLGALIGFPAVLYALIYAVLLGGIGALIAILIRTFQQGRYAAFTAIPYGPYLVISGWAFLIFGSELLGWIMGR